MLVVKFNKECSEIITECRSIELAKSLGRPFSKRFELAIAFASRIPFKSFVGIGIVISSLRSSLTSEFLLVPLMEWFKHSLPCLYYRESSLLRTGKLGGSTTTIKLQPFLHSVFEIIEHVHDIDLLGFWVNPRWLQTALCLLKITIGNVSTLVVLLRALQLQQPKRQSV